MKKASIAVTAALLLCLACSSVRHRFLAEGYARNQGKMIKRIVIVSKPSPGNGDLAGLIGAITRDVIKTNRNYLVYGIVSTDQDAEEACHIRDGLLNMSLERADAAGEHIDLQITGELRRCSDKAVVWSATARASARSRNRSLKNLIQDYVEQYGREAEIYAAPAFNVIEDLIEAMPNPALTEDEMMEKIELEN
jgi:probable lipoprotein (TIGR04455 family)